jgi:2'-5' RNA ligase superfamily
MNAMKHSLIRMPGHALQEYQLVIAPHEALRERLMKKRAEFVGRHGASGYLQPACLTLARFHQHQMNEERILAHLERVAMGTAPFKLAIRGFNSLPDHALFFHTERSAGIRKLAAEVKAMGRMLQPDADHKAYVIPEPHIALATRLRPEQFAAGWAEWAARPFVADFIADALLVLKRVPGDRRWQVGARLDFRNLPVATRQGELFA